MKVSAISGDAYQYSERRLGLEIEVEHVNRGVDWVRSTDLWNVVGDGSLRDQGAEFVSTPLTVDELLPAVEKYYEFASDLGYKASIRTSTHVHINMQQYTLQQVGAVCALYSVVEPILFDILGQDRDECTYCVPWYRARGQATVARSMLGRRDLSRVRMEIDSGTCKYTALNLAALIRFGTLEFRAAPTFEDKMPLLSWVDTIMRLVDIGVEHKTAVTVVKAADRDLIALLSSVFPELSASEIEDYAGMVYEYDSISVATILVRTRHTDKAEDRATYVPRDVWTTSTASTSIGVPPPPSEPNAPPLPRYTGNLGVSVDEHVSEEIIDNAGAAVRDNRMAERYLEQQRLRVTAIRDEIVASTTSITADSFNSERGPF